MSPADPSRFPPPEALGPGVAFLQAGGDIDWSLWNEAASRSGQLPAGVDRSRCIHELYLPILFWLLREVRRSSARPLIAGVSGPQGAGKSTLAGYLVTLLASFGWRASALSIDDFYLCHEDQERLAADNPENPYLRYRGYPGTHDLALGAATLQSLRTCGFGEVVRLPRYDKSLHGGRGDRLAEQYWPAIEGPLDIVLLDGWMLGFQPVDAAMIPDPQLLPVNAALLGYEAWHGMIDRLVILRTRDAENIVRWRVEAEDATRAAGRPALDRAAAEDYIRRFLPAYALYANTVSSGRWAPDRQFELFLAPDRLPGRS